MAYFSIPTFHLIEVSGKDAAKYLHSRLSNDILSLTPGEHRLAAALSPQGKALGVFCIYRIDEQQYFALTDGGNSEEATHALMQYKVSEQLEARLLESFELFHVLPQEPNRSLQEVMQIENFAPEKTSKLISYEGYVLPRSRSNQPGFDLLIPQKKKQEFGTILSQHFTPEWSEDEQLQARVTGNHPSFPHDIGSDRVFSEFGLREAISYKKGCYVGQEVIERVDSRGMSPRKLVRISYDGIIEASRSEKIIVSDEVQEWDGIVLNSTHFRDRKNYAFLLLSSKAPDILQYRFGNLALQVIP